MGSNNENNHHQETISPESQPRRYLVTGPIIVGAGPSGLATSACLSSLGVPSLLLERNDCIASLWQQRTYDRLKLHLPKQFCELPLMGFPADYPKYPSRDQFVAYMEHYAERFCVNTRFKQDARRARCIEKTGVWRVETEDDSVYYSKWLIVATGENAEPCWPEIDGMERFEGAVIHTCEYRSGVGFKDQRVLVVGCGNSGMEVSLDLCRHNAIPHLVVRNSVHILPREMLGISTFEIAMALLKWLPSKLVDRLLLLMASLMLGNTERIGIPRPKTGPLQLKNAAGKTPVLDVEVLSLIKSGKIKVMEGVKEITSRGAKFVDGQEKEFDSVILATGYKSNVPVWLQDCGFFNEDGMPKVPFPNGWKAEKGLYTVGFTRRGLLGTSSDAVKIADDIAHQWRMIQDQGILHYEKSTLK